MRVLEICLWIGAAWSAFFGFRTTLGLTRLWKSQVKHHWIAPVTFVVIAAIQFSALVFFTSLALWTRTITQIGAAT